MLKTINQSLFIREHGRLLQHLPSQATPKQQFTHLHLPPVQLKLIFVQDQLKLLAPRDICSCLTIKTANCLFRKTSAVKMNIFLMYSLAVSLRNLVLLFDDTGKYSRSITLTIVKMFPPGSPEQRQAIL